MESRVLLKILESVSLKRKGRSKTIALLVFFFCLSHKLDGSIPDLSWGQGLGLGLPFCCEGQLGSPRI